MSSNHLHNRLDKENHIVEVAVQRFLEIRSRLDTLLGVTGDFISGRKTDTSFENTKIKLGEFYINAILRLGEYFKSLLNRFKSHRNTSSLNTDAQKLKDSLAEVRNSFKTLHIPIGSKYDNSRIASEQGAELMEKIGKLSESLIFFSETESACQPLEQCTKVLSHAPRIGLAFALVTPILVMGIKNGEVSELVIKTFRRICILTDDLNARIEKANQEIIPLSGDEIGEIRTLLKGVEDGLQAVVSVMEGRTSRCERFMKLNIHEEKLKGWMTTTDEMLESQNREKISMMNYRTRFMMERQKRYFQVLTLATFVNIGVVAAGLFLLLDIRRFQCPMY